MIKSLIASLFTITFLKNQIRSYGDRTTDFHIRKIPEVDSNEICYLLVLIDSVFKKDENYYQQVLSQNLNTLKKEKGN